ncbi:MAG: nucleotidyltransferase domain-containing protein [Deltaproteobacteria bacterium]|nr:nucleotidyltransferase domain-containing protein [Deltaproteobacteria bacterium]
MLIKIEGPVTDSNKISIDEQILAQDEYLRRMVEFLVSQYHPDRIYLFGSRARKTENCHSDYDLLVVVEKKPSFEERKQVHLAQWKAGLRKATDIVLFSKKGFEVRVSVKNSLPATANEEGKLLYAA